MTRLRITAALGLSAALLAAPSPAQAWSAHDLHVRNVGSVGMLVCANWAYLPGVTSAGSCGPGESFTYLRAGRSARALGIPDVDAVCATRGYKVQRAQRNGGWRTVSGRGVPRGRSTWCWKVRPAPALTGNFRLRHTVTGVPGGGGGSW